MATEGNEKFVMKGDNLYKGNTMLSGNYKLVAQLKNEQEVEVSLFFGDVREVPTLKDESGKREINTKMSSEVYDTLKKGEEYFATNVDVLGTDYYGYYVPVFQNDSDEVVGLVFAGESAKVANLTYNSIVRVLVILIIGISIYSLTIKHTGDDGTIRTGIDGLKVYLIPDFKGMTFRDIFMVVMDAMGQLFFSISVAMGIMVAYGSYVKKDVNLMKSINQIEIFDTAVAFLAGLMIVPEVYVFSGTEGMSAGPGLMFISLPKVFNAMGKVGTVIGALFFIMVTFAAITSSVSVMEAIVSGLMDKFHLTRKKSAVITTVYAVVGMLVVCFGYNIWYFELKLPNGATAQILDVMDYLSNNIFMPLVAILSCILIGWVVKPKTVIDEVTRNGEKFGRKKLYIVMVKFVAPILLALLLLQSFGIDFVQFVTNLFK